MLVKILTIAAGIVVIYIILLLINVIFTTVGYPLLRGPVAVAVVCVVGYATMTLCAWYENKVQEREEEESNG